MKSRFEVDSLFSPKNPEIVIRATEKTADVQQLMTYIDHYEQLPIDIIPIKVDDHIYMIPLATIILIEVNQNKLTIFTTNNRYVINERMVRFHEKIGSNEFIQVSKYAIIHLSHLLSLSDSFSGSMSATLTNQLKTTVSRKYVKELAIKLGL